MLRFTDNDTTPADPCRRLERTSLSLEARRELVAHWMSDIHAVPDHPALRRLPDGTVFHIDDLMDTLRSLDAAPPKGGATIIPFARARTRDDDDDPKPGASAMWPTLPPVVIDARATARVERRVGAR
jgi:hypothetical protein